MLASLPDTEPKVTGTDIYAFAPRNIREYEAWAIANGLPGPDDIESSGYVDPKEEDGDRY